jgi:glycosyltransferase involved in cell wall biosynthesis
VDCRRYAELPIGRAAAPPRILFIGTLSWAPNVAAVQFLAHSVLPAVRREIPKAELTVVGHNPGPAVRALGDLDGVTVAGSVPDVVPYLRDARLLAVPLEAGGGTRLKIIEAFAAGLPVVSTPIGCEGLAVVHDRELLIAPSGPEFATAVARLIRDPLEGTRLATAARQLALDQYDWDAIGERARRAIDAVFLHA